MAGLYGPATFINLAMQTISNIIFDIGGVVVFQGKTDFSAFDSEFNLPPTTVASIVRSCFENKAVNKDFNEKEYFKKNFQHILTWDKYQEILKRIFVMERLNEPLVEWIRDRKEKYRFFALTNNTTALKGILEKKFRISDLFDYTFNSAEIGFAKPDLRVFSHILREINTIPEHCLFIDDREENTVAAQNFGFRAITFRDNQQFFGAVGDFRL